jgi:hypothetical protein
LSGALLFALWLFPPGSAGPHSEAAAGATSSSAVVSAGNVAPLPVAATPAFDAPGVSMPSARWQSMSDAERQAWLTHMDEVRKSLLEKTKYPPTSLPLAGKTDLIKPHWVEPLRRPLQQNPDGGGPGNVMITISQSQLWLGDGEIASASITVTTTDGSKPAVSFARSQLSRQDGKPDGLGAAYENVVFHDDGVAPDLLAGDNIWSTLVPPRPGMLKGVTSALILDVDMLAGPERGTFRIAFTTTGPPPAQFTGIVRDAIEGGSLAFHVGIDVWRPGRYNIMGRVYDANGKPAALLTHVEELTRDTTEIVLVAFGKTLRDQNLTPPFALKDLEGFAYVDATDSDRAVMAVWPGPHVTAPFDLTQLSDAEWDSPERWHKVDTVNSVIAHGPSEIAPVDSNGIPLPPKPLVLPPPKTTGTTATTTPAPAPTTTK